MKQNPTEAMKAFFTFLIIVCSYIANAQLTIAPGGSIHFKGAAQLTLDNTSFINLGSFYPDSGAVVFKGNKDQIVGGAQTSFFDLIIDMDQPKLVTLSTQIYVSNRIFFNDGYLFLGDYDVNLGRTGILQNEYENHRIWTNGTGRVIASRTINNVDNALPGNMGLSITTDANLGEVTIRRGYLPPGGGGLPSSAMRYFEIVPEFQPANPGLLLRLLYWDNELDGADENSLQVFHSLDGVSWNNIGFSARNAANDWVEHDNVQVYGRFVLAASSNALPVIFASITGRCENGRKTISWQTAQEQNSLHFEVQRQEFGAWKTIGIIPSAGNSNTLRSYHYTDPDHQTESLYRIVEKGLDGSLQYSSVLKINCQQHAAMKLWPNPASTQISLQISIDQTQRVALQIWNANGAKIKEQVSSMQKGVNTLLIPLGDITPGMYILTAIDAQGRKLFSNTFLKQ